MKMISYTAWTSSYFEIKQNGFPEHSVACVDSLTRYQEWNPEKGKAKERQKDSTRELFSKPIAQQATALKGQLQRGSKPIGETHRSAQTGGTRENTLVCKYQRPGMGGVSFNTDGWPTCRWPLLRATFQWLRRVAACAPVRAAVDTGHAIYRAVAKSGVPSRVSAGGGYCIS